MFDFFKKFFAPKKPVIEAPYKIDPQVHSTDTVHDTVFVPPPAKQPKKSTKKPAAKNSSTSSTRRRATTKKA